MTQPSDATFIITVCKCKKMNRVNLHLKMCVVDKSLKVKFKTELSCSTLVYFHICFM